MKKPGFAVYASSCDTLQTGAVEAAGIERIEKGSGKRSIGNQGGAESGALGAPFHAQQGFVDSPKTKAGGQLAADLSVVVAAWPKLPAKLRASIVVIVKASVEN